MGMNNVDPTIFVTERHAIGVWEAADNDLLDQRIEYDTSAALSPAKRMLDLIGATTALIFFAPLLLAVALMIGLTSRGPVLFRQSRTGYKGQTFELLKFRTMFVGAGDSLHHATRRDPRVTWVGSFLRSTSIDELPQFINVLRGEMSLVGPRPHAVAHDIHYGRFIHDYPHRFAARPGITGLAQIRGLRGEIRGLSCMARRIQADCEYIAQWSLLKDIHILVQTVPRMLRDPNAY